MDVRLEKVVDPGTVEERSRVAQPQLGPWRVTTRICPLRATLALARGKKKLGVQVEAVVVVSADSDGKQASPLSSPSDSKGW